MNSPLISDEFQICKSRGDKLFLIWEDSIWARSGLGLLSCFVGESKSQCFYEKFSEFANRFKKTNTKFWAKPCWQVGLCNRLVCGTAKLSLLGWIQFRSMELLRNLENPNISDEQKAKIANEISESFDSTISEGDPALLECYLSVFINYLKQTPCQFSSESSSQKVNICNALRFMLMLRFDH